MRKLHLKHFPGDYDAAKDNIIIKINCAGAILHICLKSIGNFAHISHKKPFF